MTRRGAIDERRICLWCRGGIPTTRRRDAKFCRKACRQAHHRFLHGAVAHAGQHDAFDARPLVFAYADPPYPGKAHYYEGHADFAGEVDHDELLSCLQEFDGWALSTSATALPEILAECENRWLEVRVAAWFRGERPHPTARRPLNAWEPVIYHGERQLDPSRRAGATRRIDALVKVARPRLTDPNRVIGAKPAEFCGWLIDLLGAQPTDELVDLYPGSGAITRAWQLYVGEHRSAA